MIARLRRNRARAPDPAPVRIVHMGLGGFHRAHQAWYTAADPGWGIAAYTFRNVELPRLLTEQDGLYTLLVRGEPDTAQLVPSISRAHPGADTRRWRADLASPAVAAVTLTVTESAYRAAAPGEDTALARLVDGLRGRWRADAGPLALVPCDNLPGNGRVLRQAVRNTVAGTEDPAFVRWLDESVSTVDTVVDRITPAATADDGAAAAALTGFDDRAPAVTEPFTEWLLAGDFPLGRPRWEAAGARTVDDAGPYQQRKLWFLNGAHTLLAYAGLARGMTTVREAVADDRVAGLMESWWDTAARYTVAEGIEEYRQRLRARFAAPGIRHRLAQIGQDGSQKIPARLAPVLREERRRGRLPASVVTVLAAWLEHLRRGEVHDPRGGELAGLASGPGATRAVLAALDPTLADDAELVGAVDAERPAAL